MSTPRAQVIAQMLDRVLAKFGEHAGVELAAKLGVDKSYVAKLKSGWRPSRVREDLLARLVALDPRSPQAGQPSAPAAEDPAAFARGVLWVIQRDAAHIAETARAAFAQLGGREPSVSPSAGEIAIGLEALAAVEESTATEHSKKPRRAQA